MQYENLRCQVLEAGEITNGNALEMAFIECRGLAAWIAHEPPGLAIDVTTVDLQSAGTKSAANDYPPSQSLIPDIRCMGESLHTHRRGKRISPFTFRVENDDWFHGQPQILMGKITNQ
jgi:hypothetical protein